MSLERKMTLAAALLAASLCTAEPLGPDVAGMDRSILPGNDFFNYANGAWLKRAEIPADRSSYGNAEMLVELTAKRVDDLISHIDAKGAQGSEAQQIADYYASFMDEAAIESKDLKPIEPALARIAAISNRSQLARWLGERLRTDVDVLNMTNLHTTNLFGLWVAQDLGDPARYSPFILQGGLGMPDRDYYLSTS